MDNNKIICKAGKNQGSQFVHADNSICGFLFLLLPALLMLFISLPVQADILMLAHISFQGNSSVTITPPAGWTLVRRDNSGTGAGASNSAIYYRIADSTDNTVTSYTFTFSSPVRNSGGIVAYDGVNGATPIGAHGGQAGSGTTITSPSVTAAVDDWVVRIYGHAAGGSAINAPAGGTTQRYADFTSAGPNGASGLAADRPITTAGATGARSTTHSSSANNVGQTVIVQPLTGLAIGFIGSASTNSGGPTGGSIDIPKPAGVVVTIDHIRIDHDGIGLTCAPEQVTVRACSDSTCASLYTGTVITTLSPTGWLGGDTINFSGGSTTRQLRWTTPGIVTLGAGSTTPAPSNATRCFIGAAETCSMEFFESGFIFDVPNHVSDTVQNNITVTAVRTDDTGQTCAPAFTGSKDLKFWSSYSNPNTGTLQVNVDGADVPTAEPAAPNVTLAFNASAEATISVRYPDVGEMQLLARLDGTGDDAGLVMLGNDLFIARPDHFTLNIPGNPAAADANGDAFTGAGENFEITVESRNVNGNITPNFGREIVPESVDVTLTLIAPVGGNAPAIAGSFGTFGEDCAGDPATGGTACGEFSWPEVGIITLEPSLASGAYLGTGDVVGNVSASIGRFIPDHFTVIVTATPEFANACTGGANEFTYMDQAFYYGIAPELTVTARNTTGDVTLNYGDTNPSTPTERFWKLNSAMTRNYTDQAGAAATFADVQDPDVLLNGDLDYDGAGTLALENGTDGDAFNYMRVDEEAEFDARVNLVFTAATLTDSDGVCYYVDPTDPGRVCSSFTINDIDGTLQRFGRLAIGTGFGSELLPVLVPVRTEYFDGIGFITNTDDDCTDMVLADHLRLSNPDTGGGAVQAGDATMNIDAGSTSITVFNSPLVDGDASTRFSAPGSGNVGFITIEGNLDCLEPTIPCVGPDTFTHLLYDWDNDDGLGDGPYDDNPAGRVDFGVYESPKVHIYTREPW